MRHHFDNSTLHGFWGCSCQLRTDEGLVELACGKKKKKGLGLDLFCLSPDERLAVNGYPRLQVGH